MTNLDFPLTDWMIALPPDADDAPAAASVE